MSIVMILSLCGITEYPGCASVFNQISKEKRNKTEEDKRKTRDRKEGMGEKFLKGLECEQKQH